MTGILLNEKQTSKRSLVYVDSGEHCESVEDTREQARLASPVESMQHSNVL